MDEWGLSEATAFRLVDAMVEHASRHGQLRDRGLYILTSEKILEIGLKSINQRNQTDAGIFNRIKQDVKFMQAYHDKVASLLKRDTPKSSPSIIKWYMQGSISEYFIALSKSCGAAISKLTPFEKSLLPSMSRQLEIRSWSHSSAMLKNRIKLMMSDDWGATCSLV